MFERWRERRKLQREIGDLEKKTAGWHWGAEDWLGEDSEQARKQKRLERNLHSLKQKFDALETERLTKKAAQLGIEIPPNRKWWWDDSEHVGMENASYYLTDAGKTGVLKLIREERRKNIEWRIKIIVTVLTALTGLVGSLIGVLSVLKK